MAALTITSDANFVYVDLGDEAAKTGYSETKYRKTCVSRISINIVANTVQVTMCDGSPYNLSVDGSFGLKVDSVDGVQITDIDGLFSAMGALM